MRGRMFGCICGCADDMVKSMERWNWTKMLPFTRKGQVDEGRGVHSCEPRAVLYLKNNARSDEV